MTTLAHITLLVEELIPEQYAEGWTTARLHKQWGLSSWKITKLVKAAGVYDPDRKSGPPLQAFCKEGHDQDDHRKFDTNGYPYCGKCKQIRQRVKK